MGKLYDGFSMKVAGFKCFGDEPQGFDELRAVNVIIGRNNSGKSALLDLVRYCIDGKFEIPRQLWHNENEPTFFFSGELTTDAAQRAFPENRYQGSLVMFDNHWQYGRQIVGTQVTWKQTGTGPRTVVDLVAPNDEAKRALERWRNEEAGNYVRVTAMSAIENALQRRMFRRLSAERDIRPESDDGSLEVDSNGQRATNIIQNYLHQVTRNRDLVERTLLEALNEIFQPDSNFTRILCQQIGNGGPWELYLEELHKGRIPLSQSGSGLKTVFLVLINLILVPAAECREVGKYVFAFEELENNLHPALLRRLLRYIAKRAKNDGCLTFITTHSSAAIDLFAKDDDAQIVHVRHDGKSATTSKAQTYIDNAGILDDLDVRASDLLQANGVIWVEGPTDRIYVNRWISLWSNDELKEGVHYQCVFYGGRLLAHLDALPADEEHSGVAMLRLARRACILIDSDKRNQQTRINETKRRLEAEVTAVNGMAWITKGREIENYIPRSAFDRWKNWTSQPATDPYEDVFDFLDQQESGLGAKFREKKPLLAEAIAPHLQLSDCQSVLDLNDRMTELCRNIRAWNGMT